MVELSRTVSTFFLLTPMGINYHELDCKGLIDAYIKDSNKEEYQDYFVFLLFRKENSFPFNELSSNQYYVEDYDYEGYVVFVFKFPQEFEKDYDFIKQGKYSKVSPEFKQMFPKKVVYVNGITGKKYEGVSMSHKIINRYAYLLEDLSKFFGVEITPEMEFWKRFDEEKETLNITRTEEKERKEEQKTSKI